jgi:hypothetical protein
MGMAEMKSLNKRSIEKYFFWLVVGLNLIPALSGKFFPTLDGAAHLYNAQLIRSLLLENHSTLHNFFIFNQEPVPNWTGHIILSFFGSFFPAFIAEKVLLLFCLIGLPLAFRALINTIHPNNTVLSFLIFPFTYSFVFFLGFYNFSIALVLLLTTINFWIRRSENMSSWRNLIGLFLLMVLTYFSHIFVFGILLLIIGLNTLFQSIMLFMQRPAQLKKIVKDSLKKTLFLLLSTCIPLLLFVYYFYSRPPTESSQFISPAELVDWLKNIRPIIALNVEVEQEYTRILFYLLVSITCIIFVGKFLDLRRAGSSADKTNRGNSSRHVVSSTHVWMFAALMLLVLYFTLPDSDGAAGFVSVRLGLLFFLLLIVWMASQKLPKLIGWMVVVVVLYCQVNLNKYYTSAIKELNKTAVECNQASALIDANSIVLPLNYSENWLHVHFSNYLGIDQPMVILENYECGTGYFPLKWNNGSTPHVLLGDSGIEVFSCLNRQNNAQNPDMRIDYVFVLGNMQASEDPCVGEIRSTLVKYYTEVYQTASCILYKRAGS